jgi:hypothetical protein
MARRVFDFDSAMSSRSDFIEFHPRLGYLDMRHSNAPTAQGQYSHEKPRLMGITRRGFSGVGRMPKLGCVTAGH